MVDVGNCMDAIKELQRNFHSPAIENLSEIDLHKKAADWEKEFKDWNLSEFKAVTRHIIRNNKYFPKIETYWAIKNEYREFQLKKPSLIAFNCEFCKDTGIRAYMDRDKIIHVCRCVCSTGINHYKHLSTINELQKQGFSEYRIHDKRTPFIFVLKGEGFRLSREIAGTNEFMLGILEKAEKRIKQNITETIIPKFKEKGNEDWATEELPF